MFGFFNRGKEIRKLERNIGRFRAVVVPCLEIEYRHLFHPPLSSISDGSAKGFKSNGEIENFRYRRWPNAGFVPVSAKAPEATGTENSPSGFNEHFRF
jgi:hypothetical protein